MLGLPNLAGLGLDLTSQFDHAELRWRAATQNWEKMTATEIKLAEVQLHQDLQIIIQDLQRLVIGEYDAESVIFERLSELPVTDHDSASQNVECAEEAGSVASDEGSLFMPLQSSVDSGYVSNAGSQQMFGSTLVAPSSGAFVFPSALSSCRNVQQDPAAAAGETEGGERTDAAAGQKRTSAGDNAASKRHRRSAAKATANSKTGRGSNADPPSTSHTAQRDETTSGAFGNTTDPVQEQAWVEFLQEQGMSSEDWAVRYDGFSATFGMAHVDTPIIDELQNVNFKENAAALPAFLSEPQPNGTVSPTEEPETQRPATQDRS